MYISILLPFVGGDDLKSTFLHKVFCLAFISCIFFFSQVYASSLCESGSCESTSEWTIDCNKTDGKIDLDAYLVKIMPEDLMGSIGTTVSNGFTVSTLTPLLEVSPSSLDFSSEYVTKELYISNKGTGVLDWVITAKEEWISVDQGSGSTNEEKTDAVTVMVDRSAVMELGTYSDELSIKSDGGNATVSVAMKKVNHAPEIPTVISPVDGVTNQSLYSSLSWQGGDADSEDGDVVTYNVYFSANESLVDVEDISVLTCSDMKVCYCDPGTNSLETVTTYYWKVVAKDSYGEITPGIVWSFTTQDNANSICPTLALELDFEERQLLRELRDKLLAQNEDGRRYINLYYRYSWELLVIFFTDDELRVKSVGLCRELLPTIKTLMVHQETVMSAETVEKIKELLGEVVLHASPSLKAVLRNIQADVKKRGKLESLGIIVSN